MCKKLICFVLMLAISVPVQATVVVFSDDFEMPHNYLTEGLGAYDGMLNGTIETLDASISRCRTILILFRTVCWVV